MALNFLSKWFGAKRADDGAIEELRAELDRLATERPAFAAPLQWLRELLPDLAPLADALPPSLDPSKIRVKLSAGIPLLRGETLTIDERAFRKRWRRAAAALSGSIAGDMPSPVTLVEALVAGKPEDVHRQAEEVGLDPAFAMSLLRYAFFPLFSGMTAKLAPFREGTAWERGYCPTCGNWPLLGEFRGLDQSRYLRCGLCADGWEVSRLWCPYCENRDHERLGFFHVEGEELRWRVASCEVCRGYVKMVSSLSALSPLAILVADAATLHLDLAAAERGYTNAPS